MRTARKPRFGFGLRRASRTREPQRRVGIFATPRSGNTWLRHLLARLYGLEQVSVHHPAELGSELPARAVIQLHWRPVPSLIAELRAAEVRPLTLRRHPLDVLISILQFARSEARTALWLAAEGGTEQPILGAAPTDEAFFRWATGPRAHALLAVTPAWRGIAHELAYEELVADPERVLADLVKVIDEAPRMSPEQALQDANFEVFHRTDPSHHWRGRPGAWRSFLPGAQAEAIARSLPREGLEGYRIDPDPALDPERALANWAGAAPPLEHPPSSEDRVRTLVAERSAALERLSGRRYS